MAKELPARDKIKQSDKWDLSSLFNNDKEWHKLFDKTKPEINGYDKFNGKLGESAENLKEALDFDLELSRKIERLFVYAHLKLDENTADQTYSAMMQNIMFLAEQAEEKASFYRPQITAIDDEKIKSFMESPTLSGYKFYLDNILRFKKYTLSEEEERLLALSTSIRATPGEIFRKLNDADFDFGTVKDGEGNEVPLSHGNFIKFLKSGSRELRKKAYSKYYSKFEAHKHTLSSTLFSSIKGDIFSSTARGYESPLNAALYPDKVPESVYENLIDTVKKNIEPLFEYFNFKKEVLGLDELMPYDIYTPIIKDADFSMGYEEAVELIARSLQPMGSDYCSTLKDGLLNGWVDRYENKGKRSGAYSSGCFDSDPYILMSYEKDDINSVYTLTHEGGHSMHSYLANKSQPYMYADYTIFVAEVASTFNETLLNVYLNDYYKDNPKMKLYLINREIENIRATLVRQTMFAEFELLSHEAVESNGVLTLEMIHEIYEPLLQQYFGGTMKIDEFIKYESMRIPHFYHAFYVYKYATGISAALSLAKRVLEGGESEREDYLSFLKLGGSKHPIDALKTAGVDMEKSTAIESGLSRLGDLVKELKLEYSKL